MFINIIQFFKIIFLRQIQTFSCVNARDDRVFEIETKTDAEAVNNTRALFNGACPEK